MADDELFSFDEMTEREMFVDAIAEGIPELNAAYALGWTPAKLMKVMADPDFRELCDNARDRANGTVEHTLFKMAQKGNMAAIQMWLFNREPEKWRDVKRIEIRQQHTVSGVVIHSVKEAAMQLVGELGIDQIQALNAADDDIIDIDWDEDLD